MCVQEGFFPFFLFFHHQLFTMHTLLVASFAFSCATMLMSDKSTLRQYSYDVYVEIQFLIAAVVLIVKELHAA